MQRSGTAKEEATDTDALLDFAAADTPELEHLRATSGLEFIRDVRELKDVVVSNFQRTQCCRCC